jgi:hypothetical protein
MLGVGAMLHQLSGGTKHGWSEYVGKKIVAATFDKDDDDDLRLTFEGGPSIRLSDDGQSCCENRYLHSDDNVSTLIGQTFLAIDVRDAPDIVNDSDNCDVHEVQFVDIKTKNGVVFTLSAHNEHNGYYGGIALDISEIEET